MSKRLLTAQLTLKELRKKMKPPPANAVCTGPAPMTESEEVAALLALQEKLRKNASATAAAPGQPPVSTAAPSSAGARKAKAASRFKSWSSKAAAVTEAATQASPEAKQCSPDTAVKVRLLPPKGCPSTKGIMVPPSASSVKKQKEVPPTPPPGRVTGREVQFLMQGFKRRSGGAKHRKKN